MREELSWQNNAACNGTDIEEWFSEYGIHARELGICGRCPVINECLEYAMTCEATYYVGHRFGIFGGLTPFEREKLAYQREEAARLASKQPGHAA